MTCKSLLADIRFVMCTLCKFVEVRVTPEHVYITMRASSSARVNKEIKNFMAVESKAVFAIRKDTSTNLLVIGVVSGKDIAFLGSDEVYSSDGKFYRRTEDSFRIKIKKNSCFNINVKDSHDFLDRVNNRSFGSIGFVCPKMSDGKMPYVRGLISLLGKGGERLAKKGGFNRCHSSCFIKLNFNH